jgi:hypothetical protein
MCKNKNLRKYKILFSEDEFWKNDIRHVFVTGGGFCFHPLKHFLHDVFPVCIKFLISFLILINNFMKTALWQKCSKKKELSLSALNVADERSTVSYGLQFLLADELGQTANKGDIQFSSTPAVGSTSTSMYYLPYEDF